ncbi:hypothetical protein CQ006_19615 [Pseudomonas cedrina]|uniref:Uncharacterized protein n=1 Tax=Pseudomonas cedrina TaxID=651740 RepID=A0A2S9DJQ5_PSECE|nr:hypothetical protein CLM72_07240 [Pseudomonas sp. MYb193]PRB99031.1 hypothetical protein CQ006_19615 [Pseudomonas cedrina]
MLTLPLLQSEPPSGRNPKWPLPQQWICTQPSCVDCQAAFASKPAPTVGSRGIRPTSKTSPPLHCPHSNRTSRPSPAS